MKISIKQVSFVLLGLVLITTIFILMKQNIATAAKKNGKKFGDWVVFCTPKNDKSKTDEICLLTQEFVVEKNGKEQLIALFQIGYFGEKKELKLIEILPLGVNIQAGTSVISSKKLISPGKYTTCLSSGCNAVANISDSDLKILLSSEINDIAFMNIENQQVTVPFSSKGLKKGLQYIK